MANVVMVTLSRAWLDDRVGRDLPTGRIVGPVGQHAAVVELTIEEVDEMLSDLKYYGTDNPPDDTPPAVRRGAKAGYRRLRDVHQAIGLAGWRAS
jgi:hypothetical protein